MTPRQTSSPMKSANSSGPIGWLSPTRAPDRCPRRSRVLLQRSHRLGEERHQDPIDDEPGSVHAHDDLLPSSRTGCGSPDRLVGGGIAPDQLHERHDRHGAEEVHPEEPRPPGSPDRLRESMDRDRTRVGGKDRGRRRDGVEVPPKRLLTSRSSKTASMTRSASARVGGVGRRLDPRERGLSIPHGPASPSRRHGRGCRRSDRDRPRPGRCLARTGRRPCRSRRGPADPVPLSPAPATNTRWITCGQRIGRAKRRESSVGGGEGSRRWAATSPRTVPCRFAVPAPRAMPAGARRGSPRPRPGADGRALSAPAASRPAARCRSSAASSSGTPSPVEAMVIRTSGRFGAAGPGPRRAHRASSSARASLSGWTRSVGRPACRPCSRRRDR